MSTLTGVHNAESATLYRFTNREAELKASESESDRRRFWAKVQRGDGCWLWTASTLNAYGHGQFIVTVAPGQHVHLYAHRVAWTLSHGPILDGHWVLHRCDNPPCCNPAHLFLGDVDANNKDAANKGRFHSPRPTNQKLTPEQVVEMKELRAAGWKLAPIAERYGITKTYVSFIVRGLRRQYDRPQAGSLRKAG